MPKSTAEILVENLHDWGVDTIFGLPGDGINGVMEALRVNQDKIRFIQVRHEESAAFMACAYAKYTGKLGVCLATSGPGGIHLMNGLYDAKLDSQPVFAITGLPYHDLINTRTQQDVELDFVFKDVALFSSRVMSPAHCENLVDQACRTALTRRGVVNLSIPTDVQDMKSDERSPRNVPHHTSDVFSMGAQLPDASDLSRAADILNGAKQVAILAGQGALDAGDELEQLAEKLGAPIIKALLGKACVPDDSPYTTNTIGLLGTRPSQEAMENCDCLLIVGSTFPYIEFYPKPGQAKGIQIDVNPTRIGLRFPVEVGLVGDSRRTLQALLPMLDYHQARGFLEHAQNGMLDWWQLMAQRGSRSDKPMKPQVFAWELGKQLRDDAIVSCDSGTIATWWARQIPVKRGQKHSLSGTLATMANGFPYAIAAQIAYPDRQCVAFVGDGGFSMLMAELSTCVKYNLPVKVFIVKNNTLGQIKWEQMVFLGNPEYGVDLEPINFAEFAQSCGATGLTVEDPADCASVIQQALNTDGPVVVEGVVDPYEPPMPAKITARQAEKFAESLIRGEPNREKIALTVTSDKVRELV